MGVVVRDTECAKVGSSDVVVEPTGADSGSLICSEVGGGEDGAAENASRCFSETGANGAGSEVDGKSRAFATPIPVLEADGRDRRYAGGSGTTPSVLLPFSTSRGGGEEGGGI